jgi:hypothetical protein
MIDDLHFHHLKIEITRMTVYIDLYGRNQLEQRQIYEHSLYYLVEFYHHQIDHDV